MTLTKKGKKIINTMQNFYGPEKGQMIFNKMIEEKKITGAERKRKKKK